MRNDAERLLDIQEAIEKINKFYDKDRLIRDELLQAGLIRYLEIIGEASKYLSEDLKNRTKEIEWNKIVSFRNFIVHNYFNVDLDIVCKVIETDILHLKTTIDNLIKEIIDSKY